MLYLYAIMKVLQQSWEVGIITPIGQKIEWSQRAHRAYQMSHDL